MNQKRVYKKIFDKNMKVQRFDSVRQTIIKDLKIMRIN